MSNFGNFFEGIGNLISGGNKISKKKESSDVKLKEDKQSKKDDIPCPDAIEIKNKIKKQTLFLLDSLYLSNPEICKNKHLVIWLNTDETTFNAYNDFENDLINYWSIERGYIFDKVELKHGKPFDDCRKVEGLIDTFEVYIQECKANVVEETKEKKACISIYSHKGSLLQEIYELSSESVEINHHKYYNIGRGEFPNMEGGGYRQNNIVVDDINNREINKYVSRAHARIGFSDIIGFYLQVELGGSRLSGNRTRIFRGEDIIEVENLDVKEPLQDGDLIELGKAVVLEFKEKE